MLYKMKLTDKKDVQSLEPTPFTSFSELVLKEINLENIVSENLFEVLNCKLLLMSFFHDQLGQKIVGIYALDENGDLTIFEVKRNTVSDNPVLQLLATVQEASRWDYSKLDEFYRKHCQTNKEEDQSLKDAHQEFFKVELSSDNFNQKQHLIVIGNAADKKLINFVQYLNKQGLPISFASYRVYEIKEEMYFEFLYPSIDQHANLPTIKGVIIDTNEKYKEDRKPDLWYMVKNSRIAAFGDDKKHIDSKFNINDIVFYYHDGYGIVAAGIVKSDRKIDIDMQDTWYRDVVFLTKPPIKSNELLFMPSNMVGKVIRRKKPIVWQGTVKSLPLSIDEAEILVDELKKYVS